MSVKKEMTNKNYSKEYCPFHNYPKAELQMYCLMEL